MKENIDINIDDLSLLGEAQENLQKLKIGLCMTIKTQGWYHIFVDSTVLTSD